MTSFILPSTAIMYVSGSPENNTAPPSGFTENNAVPPEDSGLVSPPGEEPPTPPGEEIVPPSGFTENNAAPPSGFTENNAAPPSGFRLSNNTGNAYCDSCNNDIYNGSGDLKDMVLAVQNRERAAVGVPPLVWSDSARRRRQALCRTSADDSRARTPEPRVGRHPPKLATRLRG